MASGYTRNEAAYLLNDAVRAEVDGDARLFLSDTTLTVSRNPNAQLARAGAGRGLGMLTRDESGPRAWGPPTVRPSRATETLQYDARMRTAMSVSRTKQPEEASRLPNPAARRTDHPSESRPFERTTELDTFTLPATRAAPAYDPISHLEVATPNTGESAARQAVALPLHVHPTASAGALPQVQGAAPAARTPPNAPPMLAHTATVAAAAQPDVVGGAPPSRSVAVASTDVHRVGTAMGAAPSAHPLPPLPSVAAAWQGFLKAAPAERIPVTAAAGAVRGAPPPPTRHPVMTPKDGAVRWAVATTASPVPPQGGGARAHAADRRRKAVPTRGGEAALADGHVRPPLRRETPAKRARRTVSEGFAAAGAPPAAATPSSTGGGLLQTMQGMLRSGWTRLRASTGDAAASSTPSVPVRSERAGYAAAAPMGPPPTRAGFAGMPVAGGGVVAHPVSRMPPLLPPLPGATLSSPAVALAHLGVPGAAAAPGVRVANHRKRLDGVWAVPHGGPAGAAAEMPASVVHGLASGRPTAVAGASVAVDDATGTLVEAQRRRPHAPPPPPTAGWHGSAAATAAALHPAPGGGPIGLPVALRTSSSASAAADHVPTTVTPPVTVPRALPGSGSVVVAGVAEPSQEARRLAVRFAGPVSRSSSLAPAPPPVSEDAGGGLPGWRAAAAVRPEFFVPMPPPPHRGPAGVAAVPQQGDGGRASTRWAAPGTAAAVGTAPSRTPVSSLTGTAPLVAPSSLSAPFHTPLGVPIVVAASSSHAGTTTALGHVPARGGVEHSAEAWAPRLGSSAHAAPRPVVVPPVHEGPPGAAPPATERPRSDWSRQAPPQSAPGTAAWTPSSSTNTWAGQRFLAGL